MRDLLVGQDNDCFLSKLCWDIGISCDSLQLKHSLLLSGQLLLPSDPAGLAARLASVPAGQMALKRMERKQLVEQELDWLKDQVISWGMRRVVLQYRFQLCMLDAEGEEQLNRVVDQMARLGDKKGLEAVGLMAAREKKFFMDQVAVKALMEAQKLEEDQVDRERRVVAMLEIMARHPGWWKGSKVVEVVRGVDWTVGEMLGEAMKQVWNCWVVMDRDEKDNRQNGWGKALVLLHNLATEITDHITCMLDQPTITLLRKVRRGGWPGGTWWRRRGLCEIILVCFLVLDFHNSYPIF